MKNQVMYGAVRASVALGGLIALASVVGAGRKWL
jgi:hypothetical protein